MKNKQPLHFLLTFTMLFFVLVNIRAQDIYVMENNHSGDDVILKWNRVLTETIRTPGVHPGTRIFPVRSYAMMHAAMFDAVNSIDQSYTPYLTLVDEKTFSPSLLRTRGGFRFASKEAAAAQAAHDVLVGLYPSRKSIYDAELAKSLNGLQWIPASLGIQIGQVVAARMLVHRANDGWNVTPPAYILPLTPGNWQPTPPDFLPARFTHAPMVTPFALASTTQFGPGPPPALTSAEYAAALNEVKEIGAVNSTTRTAEQTLIAQLWHAVITPTTIFFTWNNVARDFSVSRNLSTIERARLFALFNIAVHDGLITSLTAKFQYHLWRPVTAIRRADEDGNPNTEADPNWSSLLITPPYPAYTGDQAVVSMTHATVFTLFFGRDDFAFQHTWEGTQTTPQGWTRSYPSFTAMANEVAESRIYGGIHYRFDQTAGQTIGRNVGNYVFINFLRPL